jgi:dienelactone hydrolase
MRTIICFLALTIGARGAFAQPSAADVNFPSGKLQLHGALWKPAGAGPFPAIVWNHGSEKNPTTKPELAAFYTSHGYVFFVPYRRGQGGSPGPYIQDLVKSASRFSRSARMVELQEEGNADVVAAVSYLKSQSFVDAERMAISGCSYGGIQTLLAGEKELGVKALIPFAPGAMSWDTAPELQVRLKRAVDKARAPILLVQAANDFNTAPTHELAREAQFRHTDFVAKIYPPFGSTPQEGHGKFCSTATGVWGNDVLAFLDAHLGGSR